jgi:RHS repeat-associated protein
VTSSYQYEPFGASRQISGSDVNPYQFTGRENDGNGLYFYRARYYNPTTGRFISEDPSRLSAGDPNLYTFNANDPINLVDPFGLDWLYRSANFFAGAGDSLTFGGTGLVRRMMNDGYDPADHCSGWYAAGEYTETAAEIGLSLGSSALKQAAKNASREAVRKEAAKMTRNIAREGNQLHHVNPLFGHPGGSGTLFPTGGLPASIHSGDWNLKLMSKEEHAVAHLVTRMQEDIVGKTIMNPNLTAGRMIRNAFSGRGCDDCH